MVQTVRLDPWQEIKGISFAGQNILSLEAKFTTTGNYGPVENNPLTIGLLQYGKSHNTANSIPGNAPSKWGMDVTTRTNRGIYGLHNNRWTSTWYHDYGYSSNDSGDSAGLWPLLYSAGLWTVQAEWPEHPSSTSHHDGHARFMTYRGLTVPYEFDPPPQWLIGHMAAFFSKQEYTGKVQEDPYNHLIVMNSWSSPGYLNGSNVSTDAFFGAQDCFDFHCFTLINLDKLNSSWLYNWRDKGGLTVPIIVQTHRHDFWWGATTMSLRGRLWSAETTWTPVHKYLPYMHREYLTNNGKGLLADTGWAKNLSFSGTGGNSTGYAIHNPQYFLHLTPPNPDDPDDRPVRFEDAPSKAEPGFMPTGGFPGF